MTDATYTQFIQTSIQHKDAGEQLLIQVPQLPGVVGTETFLVYTRGKHITTGWYEYNFAGAVWFKA